jgi:hypothetical protein
MEIPSADNQKFSESTLKGFLLKNVDPNTKDPVIQTLNQYLTNRVDEFWVNVVQPLKRINKFDGNKINWYFQIYKEGLEAQKVFQNPFTFITISEEKIIEIVQFFEKKTLLEYLALGTSFITNAFSLLSLWQRDQLVIKRFNHIYNSNDPSKWILRAEEEEHGIMQQVVDPITDILKNIGLIISRRI